MTSVMTVLGPVDADELGVTLPHEHVFLDLTREYRGNGLLNDPALAEARAAEVRRRRRPHARRRDQRRAAAATRSRCAAWPSGPACTS